MTDPIDPMPASAAAKPVTPGKPAQPPLDPRSKRAMRIGIILSALGAAALLVSMFGWWGGGVRDSMRYAVNGWMPGVKTTASGLQYKELTAGKGAHPTDTDVALVTYEGKLLNGTTFDKSEQPTPMPIKAVVPGFSEALKLMSKGAKMRFWIPASLAYKDKAQGPIPANSTLVFDVELLEFLPQAVIDQYQAQMMNNMGGAGGAGGPPGAAGGPPPGIGGAPGAGPPPGGNPTAAPPAPAPAPKGK